MRTDRHRAELTDKSGWVQQHPFLTSFIILICAVAVRVFFTYRSEPSQLAFPDSGTYLDTALNLYDTGAFLNRYQRPEITRTPGYPFFLMGLMKFVGTDLKTILLAQAVILSLSVVILYWLSQRIMPPLMAFTGSLLAAFSPWGAVRAGFLLTEGLFLLLMVVLFFTMYLVLQRKRDMTLVIAGGCLVGFLTSVVVFVRPVLPLIPLVAITMFVLYPDKKVRAWVLVAAIVVCALIPLHLWKTRNLQEAQFNGFSDVSGKAAWQWLASSVKGQVAGSVGDRWAMLRAAEEAETHWTMSLQEADNERWRLANEVFRAHPFLTVYVFGLNAAEALIHPQPSILTPARLNFPVDTVVLGGIWAVFILCAGIGIRHIWGRGEPDESIDRNWLLAMLVICLALTATAGVSFGAGARYRIALELIVPLLAGVGLVRIITVIRERRRLIWLSNNPLKIDHIR